MRTEGGIPDWLRPVGDTLDTIGREGLFLVAFPEYRPDLAKALAWNLNLEYFDFRAQVMARFGVDAHTVGLDALERSLVSHSAHRGVVVMNAEALMVTKSASERHVWLQKAPTLTFCNPVVVVLTLFADQAQNSGPRFIRIEPKGLPEQSFLNRLTN